MELEGQWWKGELAEDIYQALRYKVCISVIILLFGATEVMHKSVLQNYYWTGVKLTIWFVCVACMHATLLN